ncbi:hypothetical protein PEDI_18010 [Persicobacter diffluens]|uniref:Uncharacterized protein n=1 Tax=Persicobacter diffluens TaxID=981 RepID=A0AAN4VXV8_9BACT|nr:hypothetical protein PEDI_18010 [Persicobacter diffluens]
MCRAFVFFQPEIYLILPGRWSSSINTEEDQCNTE